MRFIRTSLLGALALVGAGNGCSLTIAAEEVAPDDGAAERVIFDTDVGGDIDDAGALAVLHALAARGEITILAIGVVNGHALAVPYVAAVNRWFGRPDIPVGTIKAGAPFAEDRYLADVVAAYPHRLTQAAAADVVGLYRRVLAAQPDHSVTLIAVGPATNVSRLLESTADEHSSLTGVELVRRKVKFYAAGGNGDGRLPRGKPGFNYQMDMRAARSELAQFPAERPMVFAGGSGNTLRIGSCYRDAPAEHIIRRSFEAYFHGAADMDRPTWDELRVLYACRPAARGWFQTSAGGEIVLNDRDQLVWSASAGGQRAYAYVKDLGAVRAALTALMLHSPPAGEERAPAR